MTDQPADDIAGTLSLARDTVAELLQNEPREEVIEAGAELLATLVEAYVPPARVPRLAHIAAAAIVDLADATSRAEAAERVVELLPELAGGDAVTEWAYRTVRRDGSHDVDPRHDEDDARTTARCHKEWLDSLNEPTRASVDAVRVEVIHRRVVDYPDGSRFVGAWQIAEGAGR